MTSRLPTTTTAMAASPLAAAAHPLPMPSPSGEKSGSRAISGITARSWNSRIANARRPAGVDSSPRSPSHARTMAVDDIASPKPATAAAGHGRPSPCATSVTTVPVSTTCAPPSPNTGCRSAHSRDGSSSSPTRNSSSTTPNSAKCSVVSAFAISASPHGPISAPAAR